MILCKACKQSIYYRGDREHKITTIVGVMTAIIANALMTKALSPAVQTRTVRFKKQEDNQNMEELLSKMHGLNVRDSVYAILYAQLVAVGR